MATLGPVCVDLEHVSIMLWNGLSTTSLLDKTKGVWGNEISSFWSGLEWPLLISSIGIFKELWELLELCELESLLED